MMAHAVLLTLLSISGQEIPACEAAAGIVTPDMPDTSDTSHLAAESPVPPTYTPTREERIAQLENLLAQLRALPVHTDADEESAHTVPALTPAVENATILSLRRHAKVSSGYIRVVDVIGFLEDPDGLEPFISTIIICPSPEVDRHLTVSRKKIRKRLKEYGVPLDRVFLTGAHEVLVTRKKASGDDNAESSAAARQPLGEGGPDVREDAPVLVRREGSFFRVEEWGTALDDGNVGQVIEITDRKGRSFSASVTAKGIVTPVEEKK